MINCVIPKLFYLGVEIGGMKLTRAKLVETLRVLNEGASKYQARKIGKITKQRVYQVWKAYNQTGKIPVIGKDIGRPSKPVEDWETSLVRVAWVKYRVSADTLERLIDRRLWPAYRP